jgi:DNA helicase-2/ATP-dependent DNA helicase PcrA
MSRLSEKLEQIKCDDSQFEAYLSNTNTVVLAGPGSGKTTILTLKIVQLLTEKIPTSRGLACITFGREAAKEFTSRLTGLGFKHTQNVFLGTVHAFCISEIIKPFSHLYPELKIPSPLQFISYPVKEEVISTIHTKLKLSPNEVSFTEIDRERRNNINGISKVTIPSYDQALKVAVNYEDELSKRGLVDFELVVRYATLLIQEKSYVRDCLEARFPWILIDEYQDLGKPLHEMILALFSNTKIKIFAVGDPDQSIYGFNGGYPEYLIELSQNDNFKSIRLTRNYRSNQDIIDASEIGLNPEESRNYIAGVRINEDAEFNFKVCEEGISSQYKVIVDEIIPECIRDEVPLEEIAVIVGTNGDVKNLSYLLEEKEIPFYISKHDFERSDIVKWLETCALWCVDLRKASFTQLSNFWINLLNSHSITTNDRKSKIYLYQVLTASKALEGNLNEWLRYVIESLDIINLIEESAYYPDEYSNLDTLLSATKAGIYSNNNITTFANIGMPQEQVTITTRHGAKGLEFEVVIITGLEEGRFPYYKTIQTGNTRQLKEDHRIFFVCVSRAKKICYFLRSKQYQFHGKYGPWKKTFKPSRFWNLVYDYHISKINSDKQIS